MFKVRWLRYRQYH